MLSFYEFHQEVQSIMFHHRNLQQIRVEYVFPKTKNLEKKT